MQLLKVTEAKYIDNYKLDLSFNNGFKGIIDLKDKIFADHRRIFEDLESLSYFRGFKRNRWTIEWDNGVDLAPEFLHKLAMEQKQNLK